MTWRWWHFLSLGVGASGLAWILTPLAGQIARNKGILDRPTEGKHKSHRSPVPYLGGMAVLSAFLAVVAAPVVIDQTAAINRQIIGVIAVATCLAVIGLIDDLRSLPFSIRLLAEVMAGLVIWAGGARVQFSNVSAIDLFLTVAWVVGVTNAFNLMDNMDGLSAGIAAIASTGFFAVAVANDQFLVAGVAIAIAGSALGFLFHNFHPASIYMGDAGALFFGLMISFLGLKTQMSSVHSMPYLAPLVILLIPLLDTSLVTISRLRHGLSPFQGGRDHLSHRLLRSGLQIRPVALVLYTCAATCGVVGYVIARTDGTSALILFCLAVSVAGLVGFGLYRVPVYETSRRPLYRFSRSVDEQSS